MPKKAKELTAIEVSRLTTEGFYYVGGVAGLGLQVEKSGGKSWILRATVGKKRREMGLGGFPDVGLAAARVRAQKARDAIHDGIDPIMKREAAKAALLREQANAVPFRIAAASYIETHSPTWQNAKHAQQWTNSLQTHAFPHIGDMLVRDIDTHDVLNVLEPIWRTKTETASRLRGRIASILDWSTTKKYRSGLNPARWTGHLDTLLPSPAKIAKERHFPALAFAEVGLFMTELRKHEGMGALALEFGVLTGARSAEIRGATWREINLDDEMWVIPGERMKMKKEHRIPLSEAASTLLKSLLGPPGNDGKLPKPPGTSLVFPAPRGGELSDTTLNAVIQRMNKVTSEDEPLRWIDPKDGRPVVQHGFRSTFREWISERTSYPNEMAEMALAHVIASQAEAAYRRGDQFDKRRQMMDDWAAYCNSIEPRSGNVVPLRKTQAASA